MEGAEAGAEVVERDGAAERLHAGAELGGTGHVGDRGGLGDLDDQAARIDAVALERMLDLPEHVGIGHGQRGEVHRDARRGPGEQRDDLLEHHPVDRADQAVALCRRQEARRADHAAAGLVGQAYKRLVVRDASVGERDDRLVVQHEQVLVKRPAQAR